MTESKSGPPKAGDDSTMDLRRRAQGYTEVNELRERLRHHSETLRQLADATPTRALRKRYEEVRAEVEIAILHINELEPDDPLPGDLLDRRIDPDTTRPGLESRSTGSPVASTEKADLDDTRPYASGSRPIPMPRSLPTWSVIILTVILTALIIWSQLPSGKGARAESPIKTRARPTTTITESIPVREDVEESPVSQRDSRISLEPEILNWRMIRPGDQIDARVVRISNTSSLPLTIHVEQPPCKCLLFDYPLMLAPGESGELVVTIDRRRAGTIRLDEQVIVRDIVESTELAAIRVVATID